MDFALDVTINSVGKHETFICIFFGTLGTYDNDNIAKILKISLNEYEKRLSKIFKTSRNEKGILYVENDKEQEVLEKFKEEFSNELTLLKLRWYLWK